MRYYLISKVNITYILKDKSIDITCIIQDDKPKFIGVSEMLKISKPSS